MSLAPAIWLALKDALAPGETRLASMLPGGQAAINVNAFAVSGGTQYPEMAYALASWLTTRIESSLSNQASAPARKSLKNAPGSSEQAFKLDVSPEVQAVIDQSIANAIPLSEMRYVDYLTLAYSRMKQNKSDALTELQQAESSAVKAQQQAVEQKDKLKASLVVATPVPSNVVPAGKVSLKFGLAGVNTDLTPWNKLIADFTASDLNVAAVTVNVSRVSLEKLAADNDCFYLPYNGLTPEKLPKILALDPFMAADSSFDKADMLNGVLNQVTRDNRVYALPSDITPSVLKYDAATFDKAGVPAPGLTWTTNDFTDALKQLKTFNGDKPGFVPINTLGDYILNLIVAYGGLPIDYRTTPSTISFTDPATVDAIRQITDLAKNGYFKYHILFGTQLDLDFAPQATFIKPATLGAYALTSMLDMSPNPSLKLTLYPRGSKHSAVTYNVGTLYISASTANPEACYRWISAVAKNPNLFGSMPARRSMIDDPALETAQGADAVAVYKQIADLLQDPNTIPLPAYSEGASVTDTMIQLELYKALDKYMAENSKVSLEEALKAAEDSAKVFQSCSDTVPALDTTSVESQKTYFNALKACALKADPDLAPFFAGVKTD
jgi:ABC-type glycerol-3-phosphate transport system substrate-binding protein